MSYLAGDIINFPYTGAKAEAILPGGRYKLECWGAEGGYRSSQTYSGKGGYSVGEIDLEEETAIFVYSGGSGKTGGSSGGFNGGGKRSTHPGGGGASDIRIGVDSLYSRVIVAGGGGSDGASAKKGMYGGGEAGGSSTENYGTGGYGGTQTGNTWITTVQPTETSSSSNAYAGFGFGGNGVLYSSGHGGAGGGGWYGGSGAYPDSSGDDDRGGGGGSGFVWTGLNAPSGYLLGDSYYLTNASTVAGNTAFLSPAGTNETGHTGDGYVRITVLELYPVLPIRPKNFRQVSRDFFEIGLAWDVVEAIGYRLYRDGVLIADITETSFLDQNLESYSSYEYQLTAYNSVGETRPVKITAKTTESYVKLRPVFRNKTADSSSPTINTKFTFSVTVTDELAVLEAEIIYSGEYFSGELY